MKHAATEQTRRQETPVAAATAGPSWALFLDFDGTLVEFAARPDSIRVDPALATTLARLAASLGGALAIVSGRPIAAIDAHLSPHRFDVAGLHGAERRIAGVVRTGPVEDGGALRPVVDMLRRLERGEPRLVVEDKQRSVALHWRLAPALESLALSTVDRALAEAGPAYRIQHGHAVAEIVPVHASKGSAVDEFLHLPPYAGRRPVFFGDDLTDEAAFVAVNRHGGVSVKIGDGPTAASSRLATPEALRRYLSDWAVLGHAHPDEIGRGDKA